MELYHYGVLYINCHNRNVKSKKCNRKKLQSFKQTK